MLVPAHTGGADLSYSYKHDLAAIQVPAHTGGADLSEDLYIGDYWTIGSPPTRAGRI